MEMPESFPKKKLLAWSLIMVFLCSARGASANSSTEADNTRKNQRDYKTDTLTPEDQTRGSAADVELTRQIRQELMKDKSLSVNAQNIKVITLSGVATLRGPVESTAEKNKVGELAKKVSGVSKVDNQTEVKIQNY